MIQISLKHGKSPLSPLAFVQYGNYHAIVTIDKTMRWSIKSACGVFLDGFKAAMKSGDTRNSMKCAYTYDVTCFGASKKLDEVAKSMEDTISQMRFHKNLVLLSFMLPFAGVILRMVAESVIPQQNS